MKTKLEEKQAELIELLDKYFLSKCRPSFNELLECNDLKSEITELEKQEQSDSNQEIKEVHTTCDGCQMFAECGCMLDDSCPECVEYHLWTPKDQSDKKQSDIIDCILKFDVTAPLIEKGRYFETIQRDLRDAMKQSDSKEDCGCNSDVIGSYARCPVHSPNEDKQLSAEKIEKLTKLYKDNPVCVANICDEVLDRSGALLGKIRDKYREQLKDKRYERRNIQKSLHQKSC
ncbi:MAG TPA: hypothetical protein VMV77_04630 [Bacteroidales bacterium]|nr:hypothetical protein [Bacteroidales bacterium]